MATWRKLIKQQMDRNSDTMVYCTLTEAELDVDFDRDFGLAEGIPFTAWGDSHVYFPLEHDGYECVGSAPRNPCDTSLSHQ